MENLVKCLQLDIDRKKGFFYDFPFLKIENRVVFRQWAKGGEGGRRRWKVNSSLAA